MTTSRCSLPTCDPPSSPPRLPTQRHHRPHDSQYTAIACTYDHRSTTNLFLFKFFFYIYFTLLPGFPYIFPISRKIQTLIVFSLSLSLSLSLSHASQTCITLLSRSFTRHCRMRYPTLSQDLIEKWFSQNFNDSILGREGSGALSINGIATYQPFDGMPKLKEALSKTLLILLLGKKRLWCF
ncbi:unnamed protein product [Camellia sinensis]